MIQPPSLLPGAGFLSGLPRVLSAAASVLFACAAVQAAGPMKTLVIGDSLSREYALQFPVLFPDRPASWEARNWVEILHDRRAAWFDFGGDVAPFARNYAIPGQTAAGYRDLLDDSDGFVPEEVIFRAMINPDIAATDRAVIFLGGNDLNRQYGPIYHGADPAAFVDGTADHIAFIVHYVRGLAPSSEIVLVNIPHLGATPDIQADYPTDPVKTARVTAALADLSDRLGDLAAAVGIAFADVLGPTLDLLDSAPLCIGCVEIDKGVNVDADPRWLFPGDGFHPNTPGQALFANVILDALNRAYDAGLPLLSGAEILEDVLGLPRNLPYLEWIAGYPVAAAGMGDDPDGDGVVNLVEYVLGFDPSRPDRHLLPVARAVVDVGEVAVEWTVLPRQPACPCWAIVPEQSADLRTWGPAPQGNVLSHPDGSLTVRLPADGPDRFLRLSVRDVP